MKIEHIELYHVDIPLEKPVAVAAHPGYFQRSNQFTLIRLITDDGVVGESAGITMGNLHSGLGETVAPFIIGRDPFDVEGFLNVLELGRALGIRLVWIEPALWDIMGKVCGQPVYRLLGSGTGKLRAYCSTAELHDPDGRAEELARLREKGFTAVKLRAHNRDWRDDIKVVEKARATVGDSMDIMVDANQAFRFELLEPDSPKWDLKTATDFARALEPYDVFWLEEPLDRGDYAGMRELRQKTNIRIAGGELNWRFHEFSVLAQNRCLDIFQPDAMLVGGILTSRKIGILAEACELGFAPHTWTNGIGLLANMHVMAASPNCDVCEFPFEPPGWSVEMRDGILAENIDIDSGGFVHMPDKPGLGFVIDEDKLKKFGKKLFYC